MVDSQKRKVFDEDCTYNSGYKSEFRKIFEVNEMKTND